MEALAYYDGKIGTPEELMVPFNDRVHFFGDGVYDATVGANGKVYLMQDHLDRFYTSAKALDIHIPMPKEELGKLLTEQGGYEFVTPEDFRGNMTAAKLEFYGGETYTADKADLPALQRMLTNARAYGGASSCGFGAKLTVTFDDGRTVSVLKGTDSCASFMFGSWSSAMVSDSENRQFWQMFGVPFDE